MGRHGKFDALLRLDETGEPDYENPLMVDWPEVEFIVGNPPFIGKGSAMRESLGDAYVAALMSANTRVAASADFVMQWWDRAAHALVTDGSQLRRFGFVTTNSITQEFSRRVIAGFLGEGDDALSLVMAIPDHPWTKSTKDAAAVRIAMTVAQRGSIDGWVHDITEELNLDTDEPHLKFSSVEGKINPDLTIGADVTATKAMKANEGISCNGMMLAGQGFKLTKQEAWRMAASDGVDPSRVLKGYLGGSELLYGSKGTILIDFFGMNESEARTRHPALYDHILQRVWDYEEWNDRRKKFEKKGRRYNNRPALRDRWWVFAEPRSTFRPALAGLSRYIVTTETSKHRIFQFIDAAILPDHMVVAVADGSAFVLGVLQSSVHINWALRAGGWLGIGNDSRYSKSKVFDPFPFPDPMPKQRVKIAELAEELDATRKAAIAESEKLTMTELYNLREKLRAERSGGAPLSDKDRKRATSARAGIVDRIHDQLDQAVADAYGWGEEWATGQLGPSEVVARLVALNHERAEEERNGHIRWLRPEYQIPRFGAKKGYLTPPGGRNPRSVAPRRR